MVRTLLSGSRHHHGKINDLADGRVSDHRVPVEVESKSRARLYRPSCMSRIRFICLLVNTKFLSFFHQLVGKGELY